MITVKKGNLTTRIIETFKEKYLENGWKVVKEEKDKPVDELAEVIEENLNLKTAANSRKRNVTKDKTMEAEAIVATELDKKEPAEFTDNLIID